MAAPCGVQVGASARRLSMGGVEVVLCWGREQQPLGIGAVVVWQMVVFMLGFALSHVVSRRCLALAAGAVCHSLSTPSFIDIELHHLHTPQHTFSRRKRRHHGVPSR